MQLLTFWTKNPEKTCWKENKKKINVNHFTLLLLFLPSDSVIAKFVYLQIGAEQSSGKGLPCFL